MEERTRPLLHGITTPFRTPLTGMTKPESDPTQHDLIDPADFPDFVVRDPREILHLIRLIIDKRTLLSAYFDDRRSFVTAILGLSEDGSALLLDSSPDAKLNAAAGTSAHLTCVTRLDGVRLQFEIQAPQLVPREGLQAFHAALPSSMLRLQRREFYRQSVPLSHSVSCTIVVGEGPGVERSVPVRVLDISNGGIAVLVPPEGVDFTPGAEFTNCLLSIPEKPPARVKLRVRNLYTVSGRGGKDSNRAGCEFFDLPASFLNQVQRYIYQVERDRRALEPNR